MSMKINKVASQNGFSLAEETTGKVVYKADVIDFPDAGPLKKALRDVYQKTVTTKTEGLQILVIAEK
jgi:hypothetical protein